MIVYPAPVDLIQPLTSLSEDPDFAHVHPQPRVILHPNVLPGYQPGQVLCISMKQRIYSQWRVGTDLLHTTHTSSGRIFPLNVQRHVGRNRDNIILRNEYGNPCAVAIKKNSRHPEVYKLYCFQPYIPHQKPSNTHGYSHSRLLYKLGTVVCHGKSPEREFIMELADESVYRAHCVQEILFGLLHFGVERNGTVCAKIEQSWSTKGLMRERPWDITVGPGIDPSVMVALTAIMNDIVDY